MTRSYDFARCGFLRLPRLAGRIPAPLAGALENLRAALAKVPETIADAARVRRDNRSSTSEGNKAFVARVGEQLASVRSAYAVAHKAMQGARDADAALAAKAAEWRRNVTTPYGVARAQALAQQWAQLPSMQAMSAASFAIGAATPAPHEILAAELAGIVGAERIQARIEQICDPETAAQVQSARLLLPRIGSELELGAIGLELLAQRASDVDLIDDVVSGVETPKGEEILAMAWGFNEAMMQVERERELAQQRGLSPEAAAAVDAAARADDDTSAFRLAMTPSGGAA